MSAFPEGLVPSPADYRAHALAKAHLEQARADFERRDAFILPRRIAVTEAMRRSLHQTLAAVAERLGRTPPGPVPALAQLIIDLLAEEPLTSPDTTHDAQTSALRARWIITAARRLVCVHAPTTGAAPGLATEQWLECHPRARQVMATAARAAAKAARA